MKIILSVFLVIALVLTMSCNKDRLEEDRAEIVAYLEAEGVEEWMEGEDIIDKYQVTPEGVYYIITQRGLDSERPTSGSTVKVDYKGYLIGKKDDPFNDFDDQTFSLNGVIEGWRIGIPLIERGGSGTLLIPSSLGYGSNSPSGDIPNNSILIFEIDLIDF